MNLTLKPEKCKNLSICSGSPKIVPFSLGGKDLDFIKNSPMKFLGACVSFQSTSMEGFTFIHNKLESTVFCPGFQKGRVPSEKGTLSAVNGPTKGHH